MKKFWFQLIGLAIVILGATFLTFNYQYLRPFTSQFTKQSTVPVGNTDRDLKKLRIVDAFGNTRVELKIEIADTNEKRAKGLGFRDSLASDSGMLFYHDPPSKYTYWMKGMRFPIDIIWIRDSEIADIQTSVPVPIPGQTDDTLERYSSTVDINRVLETNAGVVREKNIQVGDKIIIE